MMRTMTFRNGIVDAMKGPYECTQKHTETHRNTQKHKDTQRQTETDRDRQRQTETDTFVLPHFLTLHAALKYLAMEYTTGLLSTLICLASLFVRRLVIVIIVFMHSEHDEHCIVPLVPLVPRS